MLWFTFFNNKKEFCSELPFIINPDSWEGGGGGGDSRATPTQYEALVDCAYLKFHLATLQHIATPTIAKHLHMTMPTMAIYSHMTTIINDLSNDHTYNSTRQHSKTLPHPPLQYYPLCPMTAPTTVVHPHRPHL